MDFVAQVRDELAISSSKNGDDLVISSMETSALVELVYDLAPALDDSTVDLILAEISRIDPERRPLYTQFVMEAI